MTDPVLLDAERELELAALDLGIERYRRWRERGELGKPEQDMIGAGLRRVEESMSPTREAVLGGTVTAGRGYHAWAPVLAYLPTEMLAAAGLMSTFEVFTKRPNEQPTVQRVAQAIGEAVETMFALLKAKEMDKELFRILSKHMKRWDPRRARRFYRKVTGMNRPFKMAERVAVGGFVLRHVLSTGWFEVKRDKRTLVVHMDPEVVQHLANEHSNLEVVSPMLYPMVIEPADWGEEKRGGYIYHDRAIFKPVNPGDKAPKLGNAPLVYEAINALQHTRWVVNRPVLDVMEQVWRAGGGWAGLPRLNPIDVERMVPRKEGATDDEIRECKAERAALHRANALEVGLRLEMLYRLKAARKLVAYPALHHVWQMDWRGRVYPVAAVLNPQGGDLDRGLLTFAEAVPQNDAGRRWLAIHLANCWGKGGERGTLGIDKDTFDARVAWVEQRSSRVRAAAADPLADKWWARADSPWQFLAACVEYARTDGLTQLPVGVDGTCNGLQHYSAIGLDPVGGRAVNLVPDARPNRLYEDVAAGVRHLLNGRHDVPPLPPVTDDTVKRGVMTLPYGLTPIGMRDQFIEDGWVKDMPDPYVSATYLRDITMEAISGVVVKAMEYMAWLKKVATVANEAGIPLSWTSPTGMLIQQDYVAPSFVLIQLPGLAAQKMKFRTSPATRKLWKEKQINGICPNFIHTHDAAHMMLTLVECRRHGIRDFHFIHDSFGTHAPFIPTLGRVLREQFVGMYKENPLERFKRDTEQRLGRSLPDLPERGSLDLACVLESPYFFG